MEVMWGMLGTSAHNTLKLWPISVWTRFPSREYAVKDPEKEHDNQTDSGQVGDDDGGNVHM